MYADVYSQDRRKVKRVTVDGHDVTRFATAADTSDGRVRVYKWKDFPSWPDEYSKIVSPASATDLRGHVEIELKDGFVPGDLQTA